MNAGDTPLPSSSPEGSTDVRTSYDDLRRLNRADVERKRFESRDRPSQSMPSESTTQSAEPVKPRKLQHCLIFLNIKYSQTVLYDLSYDMSYDHCNTKAEIS